MHSSPAGVSSLSRAFALCTLDTGLGTSRAGEVLGVRIINCWCHCIGGRLLRSSLTRNSLSYSRLLHQKYGSDEGEASRLCKEGLG